MEKFSPKFEYSKKIILSDIYEFLGTYRKNILNQNYRTNKLNQDFSDIQKILQKIEKNWPSFIEKIENILDYLTSPIDGKKSQALQISFTQNFLDSIFCDLEEIEKDDKIGEILSGIFKTIIESIIVQNNITLNKINFQECFWIDKPNKSLSHFHIYFEKKIKDDINPKFVTKTQVLQNFFTQKLSGSLKEKKLYTSDLKNFLLLRTQDFLSYIENYMGSDESSKDFIAHLYVQKINEFFEDKNIRDIIEKMENYIEGEYINFEKLYIHFECKVEFEDEAEFLEFFHEYDYISYEKLYFLIINFLAQKINEYLETKNKTQKSIGLQMFEQNVNFEDNGITYGYFLKPYEILHPYFSLRQNSFEQIASDMEDSAFFQQLDKNKQVVLRLVLSKLCFFENEDGETFLEYLLERDTNEKESYFQYNFEDLGFLNDEILAFGLHYSTRYIVRYVLEGYHYSDKQILEQTNVKVGVDMDENKIFNIIIQNNLDKKPKKNLS